MKALVIHDFMKADKMREDIYLSLFSWDINWKKRKQKEIEEIHKQLNYKPKQKQKELYKEDHIKL